jgi:hypothetical protein
MKAVEALKRTKEPFDPALDAPVALTPDQIEKVAGGYASGASLSDVLIVRGGTMGIIAPPDRFPTVSAPPDSVAS